MASAIIGSSTNWMRTLFTMLTTVVLFVTANAAHAKNNYYPWGWCTWGAAELFNKTAPNPGVNWNGNADRWLWNAAAAGWDARTSPKSVQPGAIICWTKGSSGMGHVAYVMAVDGKKQRIQIMEMHWGQVLGVWNGPLWLQMSSLNRKGLKATYVFAGYINPVWSSSRKVPRP